MIGDVLFDGGHFHIAYGRILHELLDSPFTETNARTGVKIKTLPGGISFKINLRCGTLPICGHRKLHPKTAAAEVAWFLSGTKDVTWMAKHAPIWNKFVEDDGKTVNAAYGYRWIKHFGRNQITHIISALWADPTNRRIYVSAWDPAQDGFEFPSKNVPCPVGFTISLVGDELHSSLLMRSSDVFVGLPYDVMGHVILMDVIAATLNTDSRFNVHPGSLHVTLAHPHLYECHFEMAQEAVSKQVVFEAPRRVTGWNYEDVVNRPDDFVAAHLEESRKVRWPEFNPRPEVVL